MLTEVISLRIFILYNYTGIKQHLWNVPWAHSTELSVMCILSTRFYLTPRAEEAWCSDAESSRVTT